MSTALEEARQLHNESFVDLTPVSERTTRATLTGRQKNVIPLDEYLQHLTGEFIWTQRRLGAKLRERGFERGRAPAGTRLWTGVGLRA